MTFLGKSASYWIELDRRFQAEQTLRASDLLVEIADLRGKLAFYESRISEMASMIPLRRERATKDEPPEAG